MHGEIGLELALRMCEAALRQARREGAMICVAVADAGGHLVSFQRMEGAAIAGTTLAPGKAFTAVAHRAATADLTAVAVAGGDLLGTGPARFVCLAGGLPLWAGHGERERVAGGIGVHGGTPGQDVACAEAAAALWRTR